MASRHKDVQIRYSQSHGHSRRRRNRLHVHCKKNRPQCKNIRPRAGKKCVSRCSHPCPACFLACFGGLLSGSLWWLVQVLAHPRLGVGCCADRPLPLSPPPMTTMDDGQALGQAILRVSPLFRLTISSGHRPLRQCVRRSPLLSSPLSSPFSLSLSLFCQLPNSRLVTKVDTQQCPSSSSS